VRYLSLSIWCQFTNCHRHDVRVRWEFYFGLLPWPNGHGATFLMSRLRVRVPPGVGSFLILISSLLSLISLPPSSYMEVSFCGLYMRFEQGPFKNRFLRRARSPTGTKKIANEPERLQLILPAYKYRMLFHGASNREHSMIPSDDTEDR
jgi:hypothetical protein